MCVKMGRRRKGGRTNGTTNLNGNVRQRLKHCARISNATTYTQGICKKYEQCRNTDNVHRACVCGGGGRGNSTEEGRESVRPGSSCVKPRLSAVIASTGSTESMSRADWTRGGEGRGREGWDGWRHYKKSRLKTAVAFLFIV